MAKRSSGFVIYVRQRRRSAMGTDYSSDRDCVWFEIEQECYTQYTE